MRNISVPLWMVLAFALALAVPSFSGRAQEETAPAAAPTVEEAAALEAEPGAPEGGGGVTEAPSPSDAVQTETAGSEVKPAGAGEGEAEPTAQDEEALPAEPAPGEVAGEEAAPEAPVGDEAAVAAPEAEAAEEPPQEEGRPGTGAAAGGKAPPVGIASTSLAEAVGNLTAMLAEHLPAEGSPWTVAVADFRDLQGGFSDLGRYLSERMTTRFSLIRGVRVVDRRRVMQAIETLRLELSALIQPRLARRVGNEVGATVLVTGTISDLRERVELDARAMDLASGRLLPGAFTSLPKDEEVKALMARGRLDSQGRPIVEEVSADEESESAEPVVQPRYENESYRMAIEAVRKVDRAVSIILSYENRTNAPINLLFRRAAYLIDDRGDRWDQKQVDTARIWVYCCGTGIELIPGTKRRTRLDFVTEDSSEGRVFTLIGKEISPQAERTVIVDGIQLGKARP